MNLITIVKDLPIRGKVTLISLLSIFIVSIITFVVEEGFSWFDAIYFLIIPISTVGFGDFVPS